MRKRPILYLLLLALIVLPFTQVSPANSFAAPGITLNSSVQMAFPNSMTFLIKAQSDAQIVKLRLHYVTHRQNYASVTSEGRAQFTPATTVDSQWVWDMRRSSLPPGAQVDYWWEAEDAGGNTARTATATVTFEDVRYKWQSITTGQVTLLWYNGNQAFANALMTAAQDGLHRIENDTGATPQGNVRIYIYASSSDLQGAQLFAQQWEGGVTFSGFGIIAIGVPTSQLSYGQRAVPHELTHWAVGQVTFNKYGAGLPTWLDEGLATYGEGTLSPDYKSALTYAENNNQLISLRSLSSPFSADAQQAYISYGESNSVVTFLVQKYGKDKMIQLLHTFQQGSAYDDALKQVYGFDQDGLDNLWKASLNIATATTAPITTAPLPQPTKSTTSPILEGILAGLGAAILLAIGLIIERRSWG
jgi:hypothetical protein